VVADAQVVVVGIMLMVGASVVAVMVSPIGGGMCGGVDGIVGSMASPGSGR
jgi:hypothetical protein